MKKILAALSFIVLLSSLALAQGVAIKISHVGFGDTTGEAVFNIHNTGDQILTDISVYVDGKLFKTLRGISEPNEGITITINLEPGEHAVEVKTPEGAYDSEVVTIPEEGVGVSAGEQLTFVEQNRNFLVFLVLLAILGVLVFLAMGRPKL